jgi:hypothetical protein
VEKYDRAGQATDGNRKQRLRLTCWVSKVTESHPEYVILLLSTATVVTRMRLYFTLFVNGLSSLAWSLSLSGLFLITENMYNIVSYIALSLFSS